MIKTLQGIRTDFKVAVQCISGSISHDTWEEHDKKLGEIIDALAHTPTLAEIEKKAGEMDGKLNVKELADLCAFRNAMQHKLESKVMIDNPHAYGVNDGGRGDLPAVVRQTWVDVDFDVEGKLLEKIEKMEAAITVEERRKQCVNISNLLMMMWANLGRKEKPDDPEQK